MPEATITQPDRQRCRHIHADGRRCGSPCLRNEPFCYFHHTSRKPISRPEARRSRRSAFDLPNPEDRTAIQLSIGEILRRIASNDVDPRRAGLLLYGLQIASTNLAQARIQPGAAPAEPPVEDITLDPALGPLAPPAEFLTSQPGSRSSLFQLLLDRLGPMQPRSDDPPAEEAWPAAAPAAPAPSPQPSPAILPNLQAVAAGPGCAPTIAQYLEPSPMPTLRLALAAAVLLSATAVAPAQQVIQRGALGTPAQVLDDTGAWTTPFLAVPAKDVEIYLPDVSSQVWLRKNYRSFEDRGQYILTVFTRYRSPEACRANQIGWGLGDQAHLDACATDIAYRVRTAAVDTNLKTVTLITAGMVDPDGNIDPASVQNTHPVRRWVELDANTQKALDVATAEITRQMARYDRRVQSLR